MNMFVCYLTKSCLFNLLFIHHLKSTLFDSYPRRCWEEAIRWISPSFSTHSGTSWQKETVSRWAPSIFCFSLFDHVRHSLLTGFACRRIHRALLLRSVIFSSGFCKCGNVLRHRCEEIWLVNTCVAVFLNCIENITLWSLAPPTFSSCHLFSMNYLSSYRMSQHYILCTHSWYPEDTIYVIWWFGLVPPAG